jgi:hypothetical protein
MVSERRRRAHLRRHDAGECVRSHTARTARDLGASVAGRVIGRLRDLHHLDDAVYHVHCRSLAPLRVETEGIVRPLPCTVPAEERATTNRSAEPRVSARSRGARNARRTIPASTHGLPSPVSTRPSATVRSASVSATNSMRSEPARPMSFFHAVITAPSLTQTM